ncbi:MAG: hypothetical protein WAL25_14520 [Acidimicrobiia bacterium]
MVFENPARVLVVEHGTEEQAVPEVCLALVTALTGKPCPAEEWGGGTVPDEESTVWHWTSYGRGRDQFMASEEALAQYVRATLSRLVEVGSTGVFLWCLADHAEELWDRPPCEPTGVKHERHFGPVRPDGSLKPHAGVINDFAATRPTIGPPRRTPLFTFVVSTRPSR